MRCTATVGASVTPTIDAPAESARVATKARPVRRDETDTDIHMPGTELGAYRVIDLIGTGGIGHVYLADHVKLSRRVALKKLRTVYGRNPEIVGRFFAEARAANKIAHENIVQITDFIEDDKRGSFIIMELLEGITLAQLLDRERALPPQRALHILVQVASALGAAHDAAIIHRDLKPDNIFLVRRGSDPDFVKILDFGVAKLTGDVGASDGRTTADGTVVGTPAYMSPEQAIGRDIDYTSDIYAFGVILFEVLTGRLPFEAETLGEFIVQHATKVPERPSNLPLAQPMPAALDELTMRCLRKAAHERPSSMGEVEREMRRIAADLASGTALPAVRVAPAPSTRSRTPLALAAAALLVASIGVGFWAWQGSGPGPSIGRSRPVSVARPSVPPARPTEPSTISVSITSDPSGAQVWRDGRPDAFGITPLTISLERARQSAVLELRAADHRSVRQTVSLERDVNVHVVLPVAAPPEPRPAPGTHRPRNRRHAVIDPFQ